MQNISYRFFHIKKTVGGGAQNLCFYEEIEKCEPRHEISNNVVCATSKGSDPTAHTRSLIRAFAGCLNIL